MTVKKYKEGMRGYLKYTYLIKFLPEDFKALFLPFLWPSSRDEAGAFMPLGALQITLLLTFNDPKKKQKKKSFQ